jgi:hypothetical protein
MASTENSWLVRRGQQTYAAPDFETICSWATIGRLSRTDELWNPDTRHWQPVLESEPLAAILARPRNCPLDQTPMTAATVSGVTIDRCPTCTGVWLDPVSSTSCASN